jgi:hypothetical protein
MRHTQSRSAIRKADKPLPVAVYDQAGELVGIVMNPDAIKPLANSETDVDLAPVPPGEVDTPADGVAMLKKSVYGARTPGEQNRAARRLNEAAIAKFQRIRQQPPRSAD